MTPVRYLIRVKGHLDPTWSEWFDGMTLEQESDGNTVLSGIVPDQAALHGLLIRIRDLGLELISICQDKNRPQG